MPPSRWVLCLVVAAVVVFVAVAGAQDDDDCPFKPPPQTIGPPDMRLAELPPPTGKPSLVFLGPEKAKEMLVEYIEPVYPAEAREKRIQGNVDLLIRMDKDGAVTKMLALAGQPSLAAAAQDAVKRWKFKSHNYDQSTKVETSVLLKFSLNDAGEPSASYAGRGVWTDAKGKVEEDLLLAYDCWRPMNIYDGPAKGCRGSDGIAVVRVITRENAIGFSAKIASLSTDASLATPEPDQYVFRMFVGFLPELADMPDVKAVELVKRPKRPCPSPAS